MYKQEDRRLMAAPAQRNLQLVLDDLLERQRMALLAGNSATDPITRNARGAAIPSTNAYARSVSNRPTSYLDVSVNQQHERSTEVVERSTHQRRERRTLEDRLFGIEDRKVRHRTILQSALELDGEVGNINPLLPELSHAQTTKEPVEEGKEEET